MDERQLVGQHIHFLGTLIASTSTGFWATSESFRRGDSLFVSEEVWAAGVDRTGRCWLSMADDPAEQERVYGSVKFGVGLPPADLEPWESYTDPEYLRLLDIARRKAWSMPDGSPEWEEAWRELRERFPVQPRTSSTLAAYRGTR